MSDDKQDQRDSSFNRQATTFGDESKGAQTITDKELKQLLEHWRAPGVAKSHEGRIVEAYRPTTK